MLKPIELFKETVDGIAVCGFGRIVNITSRSVKALADILALSNGSRSGLTDFVAAVAHTRLTAQGVTINNLLSGTLQVVATNFSQPPEGAMNALRKNTLPLTFGTPKSLVLSARFEVVSRLGT